MSNLVKGKVKVSKYEFITSSMRDVYTHQSYPDSPTRTGRIDNLDLTMNIGDNYVIRLQTYFIAPESGKVIWNKMAYNVLLTLFPARKV